MFQKAVKFKAKLRLAVIGPAGSGKTYTSLAIATAIAAKDGGRIALIDTEYGSASKYADQFNFDVLNLDAPFHPDRFIEAIKDAEDAGYDVLIIDSLSHAWSGPGGVLQLKDEFSKLREYNDYTAWRPAGDIQNRLVQAILRSRVHVIATMRSKTEYVVEKDERGRSVPRKVGMAPVQRDGFEYEFDVMFDMDIENNAIVTKTRCPALTNKVFARPGADVAEILYEWLDSDYVRPLTLEEKKGVVIERFKRKMELLGLPAKMESLAHIEEPWANDLAAAVTAKNWAAAYEIEF